MSIDLKVDHCSGCGNLFQVNHRHLCATCSAQEDLQLKTVERTMMRNRLLNNEQVAEAAAVPPEKIRAWIRTGKLRTADYPNLTDRCDLCRAPIRSGRLCPSCSGRIDADIARMMERERQQKERTSAANVYIMKR